MKKILDNDFNLNNKELNDIKNKARLVIIDDKMNIVIVNYGDVFMFPGGKIDNNETDKVALMREIKEELGIDLSKEEFTPLIEYYNYLKDYHTRDGKTINKLNITKYYMLKTNKEINLDNMQLTDKEKSDKFEVLKLNLFVIEEYIRNYKSNNPRYRFFAKEIRNVLKEVMEEIVMKKDAAQIYYEMEEKENKIAVEYLKKSFLEEVIEPYKHAEKIIDMHAHTNYSDGELSPKQLVRLAINKNIGTLAITDHDTIEGIKKIDRNDSLIVDSGIRIINGIELSAKVPKGRMHILGYGIDLNNKELNDKMSILKDNSINSVLSVMEQIKRDYDIRFKYDDIKELVNAKHNLGRPDLAKLLIKYGYVKTIQEAFDRYLIEAHNKTRETSKGLKYEECINLINKSGGIPVLAHPKTLELDEKEFLILLKDMIKNGLKGIEVYHSTHSNDEVEYYLNIANKYNLLVSGGSDYHGKTVKPDIELGTGKNNNLKIKKLSILNKIC